MVCGLTPQYFFNTFTGISTLQYIGTVFGLVSRTKLNPMSVSRPSRVKVAYIYFKRFLRWRRNSNPYISGDAFSDMADFVFNPPKWRNFNGRKSISTAEVIFCKSEELSLLFELYGDQIKAKVIITGNSDFEFHEVPKNIPASVRAMFLQNSFISDNKFIFTIPIGVENFRLGVNGNPKFIRPKNKKGGNSARILFGPLSATHPDRELVIDRFSALDARWALLTSRLSPREYDQIASTYTYIAAVRGNGVDTHRLWESLYRGLTPVVIRDDWWRSLEHLYTQVAVISDWTYSELDKIILNRIQVESAQSCETLWMPFWKNQIDKFLVD